MVDEKFLGEQGEEEEEEESYRFRQIHKTILRYLCHAWTDFIEIGFIRKLICGLHDKNAIKNRKYCRRDEILMK